MESTSVQTAQFAPNDPAAPPAEMSSSDSFAPTASSPESLPAPESQPQPSATSHPDPQQFPQPQAGETDFATDRQPNYDDLPDYRPQPEQLILEWQAPARPFKKRNRQYYFTIAAITLLVSLILFFANQFLPIAVVIAVAFLAYVLSAVPPEIVINRITTYGIRSENQFYAWEELGRFWLTTKFQQRLVHFELGRFPNQVTLLLNGQDEAELVEVLSQILLQEQPLPTQFERAAQWLQEKIPLDVEG